MTITINGSTGISGVDGSAGTPALQGGDANTGISFGADVVIASTGGVERARVDAGGRLLVGTSASPSAGNGQYARLVVQSNTALPAGYVSIQRNEAATSITSTEEIGLISFGDSAGNSFASIGCAADADAGANDYPGRLVFYTTADGASSPTERMRIDSAGLITAGSGGVNGIQALLLNSGQINTSGGLFTLRTTNDLSGGYYQVFRNAANTIIGTITQNGTTAVAYNTSSDYRLKENVAAITDGIPRLLQLKPSQFNFIADPGKTVDGFLAHEAQAVVPECVTGEKDAVDDDGNPVYQGIDQSKLVPLLTAALQEAIAKIETLEARITTLEAN